MPHIPNGSPRSIPITFSPSTLSALRTLLQLSPLPSTSPLPTSSLLADSVNDGDWAPGIPLPVLKALKDEFENGWSGEELEKDVNRWLNFMVKFDGEGGDAGLDLHFVHVRSQREDAVPIILLHGWPGTFYDFHKVIDPLTNPPEGNPAFHVVVPSLPGYFLSTYPQQHGFTIVHIAHIFHALMTRVLGYTAYAGQGGDWGSYILRVMGSLYPESLKLAHFNMFRCPVPDDAEEQTLSEAEKILSRRREGFGKTGRGYLDIQQTKPLTIGLAISTSPVALLAYIGEKIYGWSDPTTLNRRDVLDTVALYWLTGSFATSVLIYHQSKEVRDELTLTRGSWKVQSKMGYTNFPYEIGGAPRSHIADIGPLVFYKERNQGGHFAALDNPDGLVEDVREFVGAHWKK